MNFSAAHLSRFFCGAAFVALAAGCAPSAPEDATDNSPNNTVGNTAQSTPGQGESVEYVSSSLGLKGKLKENYVDFAFTVPSGWELTEDGRSASAQNFVKVERGLKDEKKGDFTLENFAVGYFSTSGNPAKDAANYPALVKQLSGQFEKGFVGEGLKGYKKVSEGKTKIGNLDAYEFRFECKHTPPNQVPLTLWGRVVLLPKPKTQKGVALIMLASSQATEIKSARDVGEKGQLPSILKTFKFAAPAPQKTE